MHRRCLAQNGGASLSEVCRNPFPCGPLSVLAMFVFPFFLSMRLPSYHLLSHFCSILFCLGLAFHFYFFPLKT